MRRLYLLFLSDAVKVVAGSAIAVLLLIAVLASLGVPANAAVPVLSPLALVGFLLLPRRYLARNLGWILGLPYRKTSLAWFNFALNLSILALVSAAYWVVAALATAGFSSSSSYVESPRTHESWSLPHGLALAAIVFAATTVPMVCWGLMVPADAEERARRRRSALVKVLLLGASPVVLFGVILHPGAISPLILFAAVTALFCVLIPRSTATALKTSHRQRRAWMLVGACIAALETFALFGLSLSDLHSPKADVREEAAELLGIRHPPSWE
jgi:hypothetical protein